MDLSSIQPLLDWLATHQQWVASAIVLIAFLESLALAGVIIPGVVLLFGASAIAGGGVLSVWETLVYAFLGAVLGDGISFFLGKHFKQQIKSLWPFRNYPHWVSNGESFFARHGGKSIIVGRFVGPVRPVMPLVAGMLDMPALRFVCVNLFSALGWAPLYVLPGYLFGASMRPSTVMPEELWQLLLYTGLIFVVCALVLKLGHWQLNPQSAIYQGLHRWIDNQKRRRVFWRWLGGSHPHRQGQPREYPLPSVLLLLVSLSCFFTLALISTYPPLFDAINGNIFNYFAALQTPWLNQAFTAVNQLGTPFVLYLFAGVMCLWLAANRHFDATLHIVAAIFLNELLSPLIVLDLTTLSPGHVSATTLIFLLTATFIAQEQRYEKRWAIYCVSLVPIILVALSQLYLRGNWLTGVLLEVLLGLILCSAVRLNFGRYNRRPIVPDRWFFAALATALGAPAVYLLWG